jgi:hypothetical protein
MRTTSAANVLDHDFLELRHRLLDIAAGFDRIDRGEDRAKLDSDPRMQQLTAAVRILIDGSGNRAERLQLSFSDPYDKTWREA